LKPKSCEWLLTQKLIESTAFNKLLANSWTYGDDDG